MFSHKQYATCAYTWKSQTIARSDGFPSFHLSETDDGNNGDEIKRRFDRAIPGGAHYCLSFAPLSKQLDCSAQHLSRQRRKHVLPQTVRNLCVHMEVANDSTKRWF